MRRRWGWWLVLAVIVVACAPMLGLLWTRALWLEIVVVAWAWACLLIGNRLIGKDAQRESARSLPGEGSERAE